MMMMIMTKSQNKRMQQKKMFRQKLNISNYKKQLSLALDSDKENLPVRKLISSKTTNSKKNTKHSIENFVIVKYEDEYFPGKVESVQINDCYEVSTMTLRTGNTFKWPTTR